MPLVDYCVKLNSRVTTDVGSLGHLSHEVPGFVDVRYLVVCDKTGLPFLVLCHSVHELVRDSDAVVGILEENGTVSLSIDRAVIACVDYSPGLLLFLRLRPDELFNIGMVNVENDH